MDLLELQVVCRDILAQPGALYHIWSHTEMVTLHRNLTGKQLREKLGKELNVDESTLEDLGITAIIDEVLLEMITKGPSSTEQKKKSKAKPVPKDKVKVYTICPLSKVILKKSVGGSADKERTIDRLKGYIIKCGVRKVWKRELEGLSEKQSIGKLEQILRELGMEGRPTLEKCKTIKERREFEEELKAVQSNEVLTSRLRSREGSAGGVSKGEKTDGNDNNVHGGDDGDDDGDGDDDDNDNEDDDEFVSTKRPRLDLAAFGDSEE